MDLIEEHPANLNLEFQTDDGIKIFNPIKGHTYKHFKFIN